MLKHKYAETLHRRLSWEKHPFAEDAKHALKRMVQGREWPRPLKSGVRWFSVDEVKLQKKPNHDKAERPNQHMDNVERKTMEHLIWGKEQAAPSNEHWSPLAEGDRRKKSAVRGTTYAGDQDQEFVIDPITNRKVAKHPSRSTPSDGVSIPVETFRGYRSQFSKPGQKPQATRSTPFYQDSVTAEELRWYSNVDIDQNPEDRNAALNHWGVQEPVLGSDEYVRNHRSSRGPSRRESSGVYTELEDTKYDALRISIMAKQACDHLDEYNAVKHQEPDGKPKPSAEELSKNYDPEEVRRYQSVRYQEPDGKPEPSAEELSKDYDPEEVARYRAVRYLEPDGKPEPTAEELSKQYDPEEVAKYRAVKYQEPDGKPEPSAEELSKNYDPEEVAKYQAVRYQEPDGKPEPSAEELSKNYTDLADYEGPVRYNEPDGKPPGYDEATDPAALRKHKEPLLHLNPNEEHQITAEMLAEQLSKNYDTEELNKYIAVRYQEPDGKPLPTAEELSKNYDDLSQYDGPVLYQEPDGKPPPTAEELSKNYTDLSDYDGPVRWNEPDGQPAQTKEELSKNYTDLSGYDGPVMYQEPDGKPPPTAEELSKNYSDLSNYNGPVKWNEPDGQPAPTAEELSKNYPDLSGYGAVRWNEPDGKPAPTAEELSKRYSDLAKYGAVRWNEPDGKPALTTEEWSKIYDDLCKYGGTVRWNEPDGKPDLTAEESSKIYKDLDKYDEPVYYQEPDGKSPEQADPVQEGLEEVDVQTAYDKASRLASSSMDSADEPSSEVLRKLDQATESETSEKTNHRKMLDSFMTQHQMTSDAVDREASLAIKLAKAKAILDEPLVTPTRKLTGNFVRDFPEEFEESWSPENSVSKDTLAPASLANAWEQSTESHGVETSHENEVQFKPQSIDGGLEGAFDDPATPRIEPCLDRITEERIDDHEQRLIARELGAAQRRKIMGENWLEPETFEPLFTEASEGKFTGVKSDGRKSTDKHTAEVTSQEVPPDSTAEPTLYKILAYDPIMQKINVAETTSVVPDTANALTPAEALLRISNPTKFFPHFAPLQAQGFEIVSGSGDILVFRKVRPATEHTDDMAGSVAEPGSGSATTPVNPIDMTGRPRHFSPASANFASPTGYVNYDTIIPEVNETNLPPPPPRFKSNIDVRREEPVFSGPKTETRESRKKHSLGKRLVVGAAWVAGISYSLGVVGEYFSTGGVDGLGPKGF